MNNNKRIAKDLLLVAKEIHAYTKYERALETGTIVNIKTYSNGTGAELLITTQTSAPPLMTQDIKRISDRLKDNVKDFINAIKEDIEVKEKINPYIHMTAEKGKILFSSFITIVLNKKTKSNVDILQDVLNQI